MLLDVDDTIYWHRYFMSVVVVADHTVAEPPKHTMSAGGGVVCVDCLLEESRFTCET